MLEQYNATLQQIYSAATGESSWRDALSAIETLTGSAGGVIHIISSESQPHLNTFLGSSATSYFPAEYLDEWTRDYASLCPRLAAAERWPDADYVVDHMLLTEHQIDHDPVYEWYGRFGLRYFIGSRLYHRPALEVVWSLQRRREQGHADADDVQLFQSLKPHLARAVSLADQLGTLRSIAAFSSTTFESSPNSVFALDSRGHILFANSRAQTCLRAADGLISLDGTLSAVQGSERAVLDDLLRAAATLDLNLGGWTRVSRINGGPPYAVFVAPVKIQDTELFARTASVLVMVYDTGEHRGADCGMLVSLYGLTDAESRLASAISVGHSIESAAATLSIKVTTARSQLKSVFRKMGVNRQQDLVRLLTSLGSLH
jgi:DNA-binding CsgD family transcriptional regulator